jgi:hypothetical protein
MVSIRGFLDAQTFEQARKAHRICRLEEHLNARFAFRRRIASQEQTCVSDAAPPDLESAIAGVDRHTETSCPNDSSATAWATVC